MRWSTDIHGRRRIWYDEGEIDSIIDSYIEAANYTSEPVIDLEAFVEQYLGVHLDQHADLPNDVLGFTDFLPDGSAAIYLNRNLTESFESEWATLSSVGRWRATLAHEIAHVLLHKTLYDKTEDQLTLFSGAPDDGCLRCYKRDLGRQRSGPIDWREYQANQGMASLLMPHTHFITMYEKYVTLNSENLVDRLARHFNVSRTAAAIRVESLALNKERTARLFM